MAFTDNGRNHTGKEVVSWAKYVEKLGAGEILLTSVDQDGIGGGMDVDLIAQVCNVVTIPVVAHGGLGHSKHVLDIALQLPVSGLAIASMLHYHTITITKNLDGFEDEGNIEFLKSKHTISSIEASTIKNIKKLLKSNNIKIR